MKWSWISKKKSHEKNQKRIKIGLRCLYIIPAIFLFLLMVMKSSKIIFLALWIVSLFILAVYLIVVEYMDYNLQNHINKLEGKKNGGSGKSDRDGPFRKKVWIALRKKPA